MNMEAAMASTHDSLHNTWLTADVHGSSDGLNTRQLAGLAIVDRVGGDQEGQQTRLASFHPLEWSLAQPRPRAVHHRSPVLQKVVPVRRGHDLITKIIHS